MSTRQVALLVGVTYRQLDWWCRQNLIPGQYHGPGSGTPREWTEEQIDKARRIAEVARVRNRPLADLIA